MAKKKRVGSKKRRRNTNRKSGAKTKLHIENLDPRVMLDASGLLSEAAEFASDGSVDPPVDLTQISQFQASTDQLGRHFTTNSAARHELVFIDAGVEGQDELLADLQTSRPGVLREVVQINANSDGLQQIADALDGRTGIDAIHIVSHGESAQLNLGDAEITGDELSTDYASQLAAIGQSLDADADILIYGCDLASGESGVDFAKTLSELTGADVAASNDVTGAESLGGDWSFEVNVGKIETKIAFSPRLQQTYTHTLDLLGFSAVIGADGSAVFDGNDSPGNDSGPNNGIVRSHDLVTFNVNFSTDSGGATNPTAKATLPPGLVWDSVPGSALGPNTGIFDSVTGLPGGDMRTIVAHFPDIGGALSTSIPFEARALGVQNGTLVDGIQFEMCADEAATPLVSDALEVTISSAPFMDIRLDAPIFRGIHNNPVTGKDGAVYSYSLGILGQHPTRTGSSGFFGSAPIEDPFTFDVDLSAVSTGSELFTWGPSIGVTQSDDGITRNYERVNGGATTSWSRSNRPAGQTDEHTTVVWSAERSTPDSGDAAPGAGTPGGAYPITVTGADTDGPLPTNWAAGGVIPADEAWFGSYQVHVWIPLCDIEPGADGIVGTEDDGALQVAPQVTNFDPDDFWNDQNNYGAGVEDPDNNDHTHTIVSNRIGGPTKRLFRYGVWAPVETSTQFHSGDGVTSVGHQYDASVASGQNQGVVAQPGLIWGDKFDNTSTKIVPISDFPAGSGTNQSNHMWSRLRVLGGPNSGGYLQYGTEYVIEFGTGGVAGDPAGWTDWNSMGDATLEDGETSTVWSLDPTDPTLGGTPDPVTGVSDAITKWRVRLLRDIEPGETIHAFVSMETTGHSTLDLAADPTGDTIGNMLAFTADFLQANADPDDDWRTSEYDPIDNGWFDGEGSATDIFRGDRLRIVEAQARLDKQVVDNGTGSNILGGNTATFLIEGSITIPGPDSGDPAEDVYVTDILPAGSGLTIVAGTVSPTSTNGNPVEYCILCDASDWTTSYPTSGLATGVRWLYGDVPLNTALPDMQFDVLVPFDAQNNEQFENTAVISTPSDPSEEEWRSSSAGITAIQVGAMSIGKTAITPLVPEDTLLVWEMGVGNVSEDKDLPFIDVVDLLPWNGDEDGSMFSGNFTNVAITGLGPGLDVYVSNVPASTLDSQDGMTDGFADPGVSGVHGWYSAPGAPGGQYEYTLAEVAAGTAPFGMSDITSFRVVSDGSVNPQLPAGISTTWRLELTPIDNIGIPSDMYVNDAAVRTDPAVLAEPTRSAPSKISVVMPDIEVMKEVCVNEFGPCDPTDDTHWISNAVYNDDPDPTWRIKVENTGTSDLTSVTVTDPSLPTGMSLVAGSVVAASGDVSSFLPTWELSLSAGATSYLTFDTMLDVVPDTAAFPNSVSVAAEDAFGNTASDSDDASVEYAREIGVSKEQVAFAQNAANPDTYDVTYRVVVENTGLVVLDDIQVTEDINAAFGPGFVGVVSPPSIIASSISAGGSVPLTNAAWDGNDSGTGDAEMFDGSSGVLGGGDNFTIEYVITIDTTLLPDGGNETNQVTTSSNDGEATDLSDDGSDPDGENPDADGDMGTSDDPTPLQIPDIRVAKQVDGPYVDNNDGTWTIPYQLVLENTGTVVLDNVTLTDNIQSQLGAAVFNSISNVALDVSGVTGTAPGLAGTWNGTDGSNILDGTGMLEAGDVVVVTFDLLVNGSALAANSPLTNQAEATGEDPYDNPVDDLSDDGSDPTSDNSGSPGDDGMGGTNDPTPILIPDIALAKEVVGAPVQLANGNWEVEYQFVLQNVGTVDLMNLQVTEDLHMEFGTGVYVSLITPPTIVSGPSLTGSAAPILDASWDAGLAGSGNTDLFNGTSGTLAPNDQISVRFTVEIDPDASGTATTLDNQADATAEDENGMAVMDMSDSGSDPNSDNPGQPGDTGGPNDPTPLALPDVDLAKQVNGPYVNNGDGTFTIPYQLVLENTGSVDLVNPSITDDIQTQLGAAVYNSVTNLMLDTSGVTGGTAPGLDGTWDGTNTNNILDGTGNLVPGDSVVVTFDLVVNASALAAASPLTNQATGTGDAPTGPVSDLSDDGDDPNGDNPGAPGDMGTADDPTPILIPDIGLSKQVVGAPSQLANGNYSVVYELVMMNTGTVDLMNVQISEDLEMEFGTGVFVGILAAPTVTAGPTDAGSTAPTLDANWDGGLAGSPNSDIFNGTTGTLVPGDAVTVRFVVEVDPDATGAATSLENTAEASGVDENGTTVMDDSDDGADPNNGEDDPTPLDIPEISLVKQVNGPYTDNMDGTFTIPYQLILENTGTVDLANPTISDDISAQLGSAFNMVDSGSLLLDGSGVVGGIAPGVDPAWTGADSANLLDGSGTLAPGDYVTVTFDLVVNAAELAANSPLTNQASATGEGPSGTIADLSDDGDDPNSDNPDAPGDMGTTDDPTPILLPNIGLSKQVVGSPTQLANGNYEVDYQMVLMNTGTVDLMNLQITEDLELEFGAGIFVSVATSPTITAGPGDPGSTAPIIDASWDGGLGGSGNDGIFNGTSGTLVPGDSITVTFTVEVDPDATGDSTPLENTAVATAEDESGTGVMDDSDDGADPNNGEDDSTPLDIPEISLAKQVNGPYVDNGDGTWTIPYQLVLENIGTVDLANPSIMDNIQMQLGAAVYDSVTSLAVDVTGVTGGTAPGFDATWNGTDASNILDGTGNLAPGDTVVVTFDLLVNGSALAAASPLTNQAEATGDGPGGTINDLSDDGDDPHSDNPDAPGDMGTTDDPTPILIPDIGLAKQVVGSPTQLANENWEVTYRLVLQNTGTVNLNNLQITENLQIEFGAGVFVGVSAAPSVLSGPSLPGSIAPILDASWDGGLGGSSNTGIFNGTSGTLVPGDITVLNLTVEIDPDATGASDTLDNQADASATDDNGTEVNDPSDDGADPNNGEDDPTPLVIPEIGVAKQLNNVVELATGMYEAEYVVVVGNVGSVDLFNLQITEDLAAEFGAGYSSLLTPLAITSSTATLDPTLSAGPWDGSGNNDFFDGMSGQLQPGENVTLTFTILLDTLAGDTTDPMDYTNQVEAYGESSGGTPTTDLSDDGTNPNTDNGAGTTDDPTPFYTPQVRSAKDHGPAVPNADGTYTVPVTITITNTGTSPLMNLSLTEDIAASFGNAFLGVSNMAIAPVGPYTGVLPTVNPAWGTADTSVDVINPAQSNETLLTGESFEFTFDVVVDPDAMDDMSQYLMNQSTITGDGINHDGEVVTVMDQSGHPDATDPDGIDQDNPSPLDIPEVRTTKEFTGAVANPTTDGYWDVTFDMVVENTGSTDLTGIDLYDDLVTQWGGVFIGVVNATIDDTTGVGSGMPPTLNYGATAGAVPFDGGNSGAGSDNLLNNDGLLEPGEYVTITLTVTVDPDATGMSGELENQSTAAGDGPGGEVTDMSDDGTNPNSDNPGGDGDMGTSDDPTPVVLPDISVTKEVSGTPTELANGNFLVPYSLVLENIGTVELDNLQIIEDLESSFGAGTFVGIDTAPSIASGPSVAGSTAPVFGTWDGGLSGSGNINIFDGMSGVLAAGDSIVVEFVVEVDPDATGSSQPLVNQVMATGDDPLGNPVMDDSDDGNDPNGDNPGSPGDMGTTDDPTPLDLPQVSVTKDVSDVTPNGSNFDVTFDLVLENTGTVDLTDVDLLDDLATQMGNSFVGIVNVTMDDSNVTSGTPPTLNFGGTAGATPFDGGMSGAGSQNLLNDDGLLEPGEYLTFTLTITVDPDATGMSMALENQATAAGDGPGGIEVMDESDDGTDPNGDNPGADGDMGTNDDPTPIALPDISVTKEVAGAPTELANGNFLVPYSLVLENTGTVDLDNLQIVEDLATHFGAGVFIGVTTAPSITNGPSLAGSIAPTFGAWDGGLAGSGNTTIFNGTSGLLVPGDSIDVEFVVEVDPDATGTSQPLVNQVAASGSDPDGGFVSDLSDDGDDPNGDNPGSPGDMGTTDDPTPLELPQVRVTKDVTDVVANGENFDVTFDMVLENTGTVDLTGIDLIDNLNTQMGAMFVGVVNATIDGSGVASGTPPTLNYGATAGATPFDGGLSGAGSDNLLNDDGLMEPGESVTVTITITIDPDATGVSMPIENQATVIGDGPGGVEVDDLSDDGTDPNSDNPGEDGDMGTNDDPTPVALPDISVTKEVFGTPVELANGNFEVAYRLVLENTGSVDLQNLQIAEDLQTHLGANVYVGITSAPTISVGPADPASIAPSLGTFDGGLGGSTNTNIFNGTSGLLVPGDFLEVLFSIEVDPNANGSGGTLENQVTATGQDENGIDVLDESDDGNDPNGDNAGSPGDMGTTDDPTPLSLPQINSAKEVIGAPQQVSGMPTHYDVTYQVVLENTGNVTLDGLDLYDDVATEFGAAFVAISGSPVITTNSLGNPANLPTLNAGFVPDTSMSMFNDDGMLAPGETITLQFVVTVDSIAADGMTLLNQAEVIADDPATGAEDGPSDLSDDGSDPDDVNTGSPGDMGTTDDPTPVVLPDATIGLAKAVVDVNDLTATIEFNIENFGNVLAHDVQIADDLDSVFGAGNYTVDSISLTMPPTDPSSSINVETGFDGSGVSNLLDVTATNTLAVGDEATVTIEVTVINVIDPDGPGPAEVGEYENTAIVMSTDGNGNEYMDDSTDGTDPDPDGDGGPEENDPTPIEVGAEAPVEISKSATVVGDMITYTMRIENVGNTTALDVSIVDNLDIVFGAGNYTVTGTSILTLPTLAGSSLSLNTNYSGTNGSIAGVPNNEIFDTSNSNTLEDGDFAEIQVTIDVNKLVDQDGSGPLVFGEYENTAMVSNVDPTGNMYDGEDNTITDPLVADGTIDLEKTAEVIDDTTVRFTLTMTNTGNSLASNIELTEDLAAVFGVGNYTIDAITMPVLPADADSSLALNLGYTGGTGITSGVPDTQVFNSLVNNTLDVGDTATVEIYITANEIVDQDGAGGMALGTYLNTATVASEDPNGGDYDDVAEDGFELQDDYTVGVAKDSNWDDATDTGTFTFHLEHFGNTEALNLSMTENLDAVFGAGNYTLTSGPTLVSGPGTISTNSDFDGSGNTELISAGSSLSPGETAEIEIGIAVTWIADTQGNGLGNYENQVELTTENSDGDMNSDLSVDGTDPDPDGDGNPDENSPSTGFLTPQAWVGGAKTAVVAEDNDSVTFDFYLEHLGNTPANNITLTENLDDVFGAGNYVVTNIDLISGPSGLAANGGFNGNSDDGVVLVGSTMNPGETATIRIEVGLTGAFGPYENQGIITTEDGDGGTYDDATHDGTDPDPDGDGDPRNNDDPTEFEIASGELSGNVYVDSDGDGFFDPDETPIPGVIITLTGTDINGNPVTLTTTTAADGSYFFDDLLPGDYTVTQTQPTGFIDGIDTLGDSGGFVTNDTFTVSLGTDGEPFEATEYNFGEAGIDPLHVGKDPFLASADNGVSEPLAARTEPVSFEQTDAIEEEGSVLRVVGTNQSDKITVRAGIDEHVIVVNGVGFEYDAADYDRIDVRGLGGNDSIEIFGSELDDQADLLANRGKVVSQSYHIGYASFENVSVHGGKGGMDRAIMADSVGNDVFVGSATFASMRDINNAYRNESRGFEIVTGNSVLGGFDRAVVYGTSQADHLRVMPEFAQLTRGNSQTEFRANQFDRFEAKGLGGNDVAEFTDSVGNDQITLEQNRTVMIGNGFHNTATDFATVHARATRGGNDQATFFDSAGDDIYIVRPDDSISMTGQGYQHRVWGFDGSTAYATNGGRDHSFLYDTDGDDVFIARPTSSSITGRIDGQSYQHTTHHFEVMTGNAVNDGFDAAFAYDSAGDDQLTIRPDYAEVRGANGDFTHRMLNFQTVLAHGNAGGNDTATFLDSSVFSPDQDTNDRFFSAGNRASLNQMGTEFRKTAEGYETINAFSTGGDDVAVFEDVQVFERLEGRGSDASIARRGTRVNGFETVQASSKANHNPTADLEIVNYVFEQFGDWFNL